MLSNKWKLRVVLDLCLLSFMKLWVFFPPSSSLLEERVTRLHGQLQRHQQQLLASPGSGTIDNKMLDDLYEDIHWLILVTGWSFVSF